MSNFKDRWSYLILENRIKAPKENSSFKGSGLSNLQQNMVWKDYYKLKSLFSHKLPIFSVAALQYYLMPDVTHSRVIIPNSPLEHTQYVSSEINSGQMISTPELKATNTIDGIQGEINEVKVLNNLMDSPEHIDLKNTINNFANSVSKRKLKYLSSYLRLFSQIEDKCTDIVMCRGTLTDIDGTIKNTLYIVAFVGDNYLISYNHGAIKEESLKTRIHIHVIYRTPSGNVYTNKISISTIGRKTTEQIHNVMAYSMLVNADEGHICNNIQENYYSLNNIRALSGVI